MMYGSEIWSTLDRIFCFIGSVFAVLPVEPENQNFEKGPFHVKWCKPGHEQSQKFIRICQIVTISKIW